MGLFKSLTNTFFVLLWSGQTLSRLGDSIYKVALAWWVLEKTGSAVAMGKIFIFSFTPMLLFLLIGGVAVDRLSRVRLMVLSDIIRGVVVCTVALLAFGHRLEVWHVYIASALFGLVGAFFQPAYSAVLPEIVQRELLSSANSLTSLSKQLSDTLGPLLGAGIVAAGGTAAAFAANGLSFFISMICLVPLLKLSLKVPADRQQQGLLSDLREGISTVFIFPWLWITITIASLANITLSGQISVALPFLIKNDLHANVRSLGIVYSMLALGSVLATVWLGRAVQIRRRGLVSYGALILMGLTSITFGLSTSVVEASIAALTCGASVSLFGLVWVNTLQELVPREQLGRVSSIDYFGSSIFLPIGFGLAGWATDALGAGLVFIIGGCFTFLLGAVALLHPAVRNLD